MYLIVVEVDEQINDYDEAVQSGHYTTSGANVHHLHKVSVIELQKKTLIKVRVKTVIHDMITRDNKYNYHGNRSTIGRCRNQTR